MSLTRFQILKGIQPPPPENPLKSGFLDRYRAWKGSRDRVGIVSTDPNSCFCTCKCHYHLKLRKYFLCKSKVNQEICCVKLGPPRWRIGAPLVKYRTDKSGGLLAPLSFEVLPWIFGENTLNHLNKMNNDFLLKDHDFIIECSNQEYQYLIFIPCKESIWQFNEEIKGNVLRESIFVKEFIKKTLAADIDLLELEETLHDTVPNP